MPPGSEWGPETSRYVFILCLSGGMCGSESGWLYWVRLPSVFPKSGKGAVSSGFKGLFPASGENHPGGSEEAPPNQKVFLW